MITIKSYQSKRITIFLSLMAIFWFFTGNNLRRENWCSETSFLGECNS